jgi:hypothetical protein
VPRGDDALGAGTCSLNNGFTGKGDVGHFKRRISEIEAGWRPAANLSHADIRKTAFPERQSLIHSTDHGDVRSSIGQHDGGSGKGPENINDGHRPRRSRGALQKTSNADFHESYSPSQGRNPGLR